jgi:hypothetical protein
MVNHCSVVSGSSAVNYLIPIINNGWVNDHQTLVVVLGTIALLGFFALLSFIGISEFFRNMIHNTLQVSQRVQSLR